MRILCVTAQKPDSTGSGVYLAETARCMAQAGHDVGVVCGVGASDDIASLPDGTWVRPVRFQTPRLPFPVCGMSDAMPYPSTRYRDLTPAMLDAFEGAFGQALAEAAREFRPDVVVCHHLYLVAALAREVMPEVPMAALSHSTDLRQMGQHDLERGRIMSAMRRMDVVLALHEAQARQIEETYGVDPARVRVVGTGFNASVFRDDAEAEGRRRARAESGAPSELVYAGKIWRKKGVVSLLRALGEVDAPRGLRLTLAGGNGGEQGEFRAVQELARACRWPVEMPGRLAQPRLARAYRAADVFVLPSFFEGLPLVAVEALACGCKVVMTDLPGIRPWVEGNVPGADVTWVEPPRMACVDEPLAADLPAFEHRLAQALSAALATPARPCDVSALSWERVTGRIVEAAAGSRRG